MPAQPVGQPAVDRGDGAVLALDIGDQPDVAIAEIAAGHHDRGDLGMGQQRGFHLERLDPVAPDLDLVVNPSTMDQLAVVDDAEVPRAVRR